jgi:hypothetical protein
MDSERLAENIIGFISQLDDDARVDGDLLLGAVAEGLHLQRVVDATNKTANITLKQLGPALEHFIQEASGYGAGTNSSARGAKTQA